MLRTLTIFLLFSLLLYPQSGEKRITPVEAGRAAQFNRAQTIGVAVLVGVGKYPRYGGLSQLHYPARDVDLLAASLEKQRYLVFSLKESDATRASILNAIKQAGEAVAGENLTIVFFFSGHGFAVNGENYLATLDADSNNLAATGLSVRAVEAALVATHTERRVMWIDACRDEPGKGVSDARSFASLKASNGTRVLLSTKAGKISYEDEKLQQGTFSYYLVKGLNGEAAGPDGLVTFKDLANYVTQQVRARSVQTGHVQVPYEAGEATGDFLLAHAAPVANLPRTPDPGLGPSTGAAESSAPGIPGGTTGSTLKPGATIVNPRDGLTYVWIPAGRFTMGCAPDNKTCGNDSKPAHLVMITKGFFMGQTEVTQAAYVKLAGTNPSHFIGMQRPVENVNFTQAKTYCEGIGGRLPTEAEWEYAARAGTTQDRYGNLNAIAWFHDNSAGETHNVKGKQPNAWGLYDMLGNVWEWVWGWYTPSYSGDSVIDPQGPPTGQAGILRGGSYSYREWGSQASIRYAVGPAPNGGAVGFRCVWPMTAPSK